MSRTFLPRDSNNASVAGVYVPTVGIAAIQGGNPSTDSAQVTTAPMMACRAVANILSQASSAHTTSSASSSLMVGQYSELAVDITVSAVSGTSPSATFYVERQGADGLWYQVWASSAITAVGTASTSIGAGLTVAQAFGATVRLRWALSGTTPSFTFSASIIGK